MADGTDPQSSNAPRRLRVLRVGAVLVAAGLISAAAFVGYRFATRPPEKVVVRVVGPRGTRVLRVDEGTPLSEALGQAGVRPRDGRLLSALHKRVLNAAADPAVILLDGRPASRSTLMTHGGPDRVITTVDGRDHIEGTRAVEEEIPTPGVVGNLRHVEERGRPGRLRKVIGVRSGEVVSSKVLAEAVAPRRTTRKVVALTFDDGPTAQWTPYVLSVLASKGVRATFCEVGTQVQLYPALAKAVVDAGHQLCNHTLGHDIAMVAAGDLSRIEHQVLGGRDSLVAAGLPAPVYYRPPGGYLSDPVKDTARQSGERVLMWSVDTKDWQKGST
ncbi:MAG: polysaccharide deacetylase family protein, partial [Aquihabitans sp.]